MYKRLLTVMTVMIMILSSLCVFSTVNASQVGDLAWVAEQEVGNADGTKYHNYSPDTPWCAFFVSWCARQAGIDESIIPSTGAARVLQSSGEFHLWNSGYYPKKGDLFILNPINSNGYYEDINGASSHVGIVTEDYNEQTGTYKVVHGNWGNRVVMETRTLWWDSANADGSHINRLKGFVTPNYTDNEITVSNQTQLNSLIYNLIYDKDYGNKTKVIIKNGDYVINNTLYIKDKQNLVIDCEENVNIESMGKNVKDATIIVENCENLTFNSLNLTTKELSSGNSNALDFSLKKNEEENFKTALNISSSKNIRVKNSKIYGSKESINVLSSSEIYIDNSSFSEGNSSCICLLNCDKMYFSDCVFERKGMLITTDPFVIAGLGRIVFENCTMKDNFNQIFAVDTVFPEKKIVSHDVAVSDNCIFLTGNGEYEKWDEYVDWNETKDVKLVYDGEEVKTKIISDNNQPIVELTDLIEKLGGTWEENKADNKIICCLGNVTSEVEADSLSAIVNSEKTELSSCVYTLNDKLVCDIALAASIFSWHIWWNEDENTIEVTSK